MRKLTLNISLLPYHMYDYAKQARLLPNNPTVVDGMRIPDIVKGLVNTITSYGLTVQRHRVDVVYGEPLVILEVAAAPYAEGRLYNVARLYAQQAVSVYDHHEEVGYYTGEYAHTMPVWDALHFEFFNK